MTSSAKYDHAAIAAYAEDLARLPPPGAPQGVPIPGSERPGRSPVYRHWRFHDRQLLSTLDPNARTLHETFEASAQRYPRQPCLGSRPWLAAEQRYADRFEWMTYDEVAKRRKNFGLGVVEIHKRIGYNKDKYGIGLWAQNRPEWQIVDLGCMSQGLFTVSLYETLGPEAVEYISNHAELSCIVCSVTHIPVLLKLAPRLPHLKIIISMDALVSGEQPLNTKAAIMNQFSREVGIHIYSIHELEKLGAESGRSFRPATPEDLYTINYTSGTTGPPKGVVITQRASVAGNAMTRICGLWNKDDVGLSYLPLAHMGQRLVEHGCFAEGCSTGYFRGDMLGLTDDIKLLQPTHFVSVPRVFNRFNATIRAATVGATGMSGALSRHVIESKKTSRKLPLGQTTSQNWLYDRIWNSRVRGALGFSRLRHMTSGSAPLDPEVHEFLLDALGKPLTQVYGMTESTGIATAQLKGDNTTGHVGPPSPTVEICLESIPEMEYSVDDKPYPRGEILLRGPAMFSGYFKNEEENSKTIEPDGWFHSGDVASVDQLGRFRIIDRKKNLIKLANGEFVALERLENTYTANCSLIAAALVHGDSVKSDLVGIFGVNPETFAPFAAAITGQRVDPQDAAALKIAASHPAVKQAFLKALDGIATSHRSNGYERIKSLHLDVEPFTVENGTLTPTLKLKRPQARKLYRTEIDRMYAELELRELPKGKM